MGNNYQGNVMSHSDLDIERQNAERQSTMKQYVCECVICGELECVDATSKLWDWLLWFARQHEVNAGRTHSTKVFTKLTWNLGEQETPR